MTKATSQRWVFWFAWVTLCSMLSTDFQILSFDVPLMKDALQKVNCKVPMTMIVVNKLQGVRFFLPKV